MITEIWYNEKKLVMFNYFVEYKLMECLCIKDMIYYVVEVTTIVTEDKRVVKVEKFKE